MAKRDKLDDGAIREFTARAGWAAEGGALVKTFIFKHYGAGMGFAVHLGFAAEKRDHHPELHVSWGKVRVEWTTHDAGGITDVDREMAELTDKLFET